jgi:hypothetical protein
MMLYNKRKMIPSSEWVNLLMGYKEFTEYWLNEWILGLSWEICS